MDVISQKAFGRTDLVELERGELDRLVLVLDLLGLGVHLLLALLPATAQAQHLLFWKDLGASRWAGAFQPIGRPNHQPNPTQPNPPPSSTPIDPNSGRGRGQDGLPHGRRLLRRARLRLHHRGVQDGLRGGQGILFIYTYCICVCYI